MQVRAASFENFALVLFIDFRFSKFPGLLIFGGNSALFVLPRYNFCGVFFIPRPNYTLL